MKTIICQKSKVKSRKVFFTYSFLFYFLISFSQEKPADSSKINELDAVLVSAIRVDSKTPVTFSNMTKKELKTRNLGQDIPILMVLGKI